MKKVLSIFVVICAFNLGAMQKEIITKGKIAIVPKNNSLFFAGKNSEQKREAEEFLGKTIEPNTLLTPCLVWKGAASGGKGNENEIYLPFKFLKDKKEHDIIIINRPSLSNCSYEASQQSSRYASLNLFPSFEEVAKSVELEVKNNPHFFSDKSACIEDFIKEGSLKEHRCRWMGRLIPDLNKWLPGRMTNNRFVRSISAWEKWFNGLAIGPKAAKSNDIAPDKTDFYSYVCAGATVSILSLGYLARWWKKTN